VSRQPRQRLLAQCTPVKHCWSKRQPPITQASARKSSLSGGGRALHSTAGGPRGLRACGAGSAAGQGRRAPFTAARVVHDRAATEFRRTQQRTAYAEVLDATLRYLNGERQLVFELRQYRPGRNRPADLDSYIDASRTNAIAFGQKRAVTTLLDSEATESAVRELSERVKGVYDAVSQAVRDAEGGTLASLEELDDLDKQIESVTTQPFIDVARKDLGVYS
jgi:hypothetical protein